MDIRKIRKAMRSGNPANSLYSLIPESQRKQFVEFAKSFGVGEGMIRELLNKEWRSFHKGLRSK